MIKLTGRMLLTFILFSFTLSINAQPTDAKPPSVELRPYKLLNSGKQITIKCTRNIKHVMLWTTGGNRVVEQKEINNQICIVDIPVNQKTFFMMIALDNGKIYTEKIGIR